MLRICVHMNMYHTCKAHDHMYTNNTHACTYTPQSRRLPLTGVVIL